MDTYLRKHVDADEIIQKNLDLEDKLTQVREETKCIGTSESLNKDKTELLRLHEMHNHIIFTADLQLLSAAGHFPKRLYKCARSACATSSYGKAHKKHGDPRVNIIELF